MKPGHFIAAGIGLVLIARRWITIADDAWAIINDPRQANKPGEVPWSLITTLCPRGARPLVESVATVLLLGVSLQHHVSRCSRLGILCCNGALAWSLITTP